MAGREPLRLLTPSAGKTKRSAGKTRCPSGVCEHLLLGGRREQPRCASQPPEQGGCARARPLLVGRNYKSPLPRLSSSPALQKRGPSPNLKEPAFLPGAEENWLQNSAAPPRKPAWLSLKLSRAWVRTAGRGPSCARGGAVPRVRSSRQRGGCCSRRQLKRELGVPGQRTSAEVLGLCKTPGPPPPRCPLERSSPRAGGETQLLCLDSSLKPKDAQFFRDARLSASREGKIAKPAVCFAPAGRVPRSFSFCAPGTSGENERAQVGHAAGRSRAPAKAETGGERGSP